jgi:hypothetical protein
LGAGQGAWLVGAEERGRGAVVPFAVPVAGLQAFVREEGVCCPAERL